MRTVPGQGDNVESQAGLRDFLAPTGADERAVADLDAAAVEAAGAPLPGVQGGLAAALLIVFDSLAAGAPAIFRISPAIAYY